MKGKNPFATKNSFDLDGQKRKQVVFNGKTLTYTKRKQQKTLGKNYVDFFYFVSRITNPSGFVYAHI